MGRIVKKELTKSGLIRPLQRLVFLNSFYLSYQKSFKPSIMFTMPSGEITMSGISGYTQRAETDGLIGVSWVNTLTKTALKMLAPKWSGTGLRRSACFCSLILLRTSAYIFLYSLESE